MKPSRFSALTLAVLVSSTTILSGCLKSRTQIAKDEDGPDTTMPTRVTEVRPAPEAAALDEMRAEINRLTSKIDELEKKNSELNSDLTRQSKTKTNEATQLEERIHELEQSQAAMIEAMKKKEKEVTAAKADPGSTLKKAHAQFDEKEYSEVVELLSDYVKNPKNPKLDEAYLLRAESYYHLKQYKKAILDYSAITEKFPKSKKVPQCLLRIGRSFDKLGMKSDAKMFYQELQDKYPNSAEAKSEKKGT